MAKAKKNKKDSVAGMKKEDMIKEITSLRENLRSISFKAEGSRSKNVKEAGNIKKRIARMLTEMNKNKEN